MEGGEEIKLKQGSY